MAETGESSPGCRALPDTARMGVARQSFPMGCTLLVRKDGGKKCPGLHSERRTVGRPLINIPLTQKAWAMYRWDGDEEVTVDARKRAWVQRFAKRCRKREGPGFSQRSTRLTRSCAPGRMVPVRSSAAPSVSPFGARAFSYSPRWLRYRIENFSHHGVFV